MHHRVHFFKVYFFVTVPPTVPLNNRTKVKHGTLELKTHEKFIRMIEPHLVVQLMKDSFQTNPLQGTRLKYLAIQLNTFLIFYEKLNLM